MRAAEYSSVIGRVSVNKTNKSKIIINVGVPKTEGNWLWHFIWMSVAFSINHGCIMSVIVLVSADFDDTLGPLSNGVLYLSYTLSAIIFAVPLLKNFGAKKVLFFSALTYACYVVAFAVIAMIGENKLQKNALYAIVVAGGVIGGFGAGCLWTGQGVYFAKAAELHAANTGNSVETVNGKMAAIFSTIFVSLEVVLKIFSTIIFFVWKDQANAKKFIYIFYAGAAITSGLCMSFIKALPAEQPKDTDEKDTSCASLNSFSEIIACAKNIKMWLLGFFGIAFGWCEGYMVFYIYDSLSVMAFGKKWIGVFTALPAIYCAFAGIPLDWLSRRTGKCMIMMLGIACFMILGLVPYLVSEAKLASKGPTIALLITFGNGRIVFSSTLRAVFADFFPEMQSGAFAFLALFSGLTGGISFLTFTTWINLDTRTSALIQAAIAGVAMITTPIAFWLHRRDSKTEDLEEALLEEYTHKHSTATSFTVRT